jgi:hypothetical protein
MNSEYVVILVQSTSQALKGERLLNRAGIGCKLILVPRHLSSDCGVCLRVAREDSQAALKALEEAHLVLEAMCDL